MQYLLEWPESTAVSYLAKHAVYAVTDIQINVIKWQVGLRGPLAQIMYSNVPEVITGFIMVKRLQG